MQAKIRVGVNPRDPDIIGFAVEFSYNKDTVDAVKNIIGRVFDKRTKSWWIPLVRYKNLLKLFPVEINFYFPDARNLIDEFEKQGKKVEFLWNLPVDYDLELPIKIYNGEPSRFQKIDSAIMAWHKYGCIINGSEMGVGKTLEALMSSEILIEEGKINKTIIVCPASIKLTWFSEINNWFPNRVKDTFVISGNKNKRISILEKAKMHAGITYIVINYDLVGTSAEMGQTLDDNKDSNLIAILNIVDKKTLLICDEIHKLKNLSANRTSGVWRIRKKVKHIIGLSGTPMKNNPFDLYSISKLMDEGIFGSKRNFEERFIDYDITGRMKLKNEDHLRNCFSHFFIRRRKEEVMPWLPPKTHVNHYIELTTAQKIMYKDARDKFIIFLLSGDIVSINNIMTQILRFKQITASTHLLDPESPTNSGKLNYLEELLEDIIAESNEKVVVFSYFRGMIEEVMSRFAKFNPVMIMGAMSESKKEDSKYKFNEDDNCKLLAMTSSGTEGLNLQKKCSTMIFLDKMWVPGDNDQGEYRLHRRGQTKPVTIIDMMATIDGENTVDYKIEQVLLRKRKWFNALINDANGGLLKKIREDSSMKEIKSIVEELI